MSICLPKIYREKLLNALKSGELTIEKLYKLSDAESHALLAKYVGKENATFVNAKFEAAKSSNQKAAFVNWIKKNTTYFDPVRKDMLKRVERNKKFLSAKEVEGFMDDLVQQKLGFRVSEMEAKTLMEMSEKIQEAKAKIPETSPRGSIERFEYGYALGKFQQFIKSRKLAAESIKIKERFLPENYWENIVDVAGITKSLVANLDNSFIGRQGIKVFYNNPKIWGQTAIKSIELFGRELFAKSPERFFESRPDTVMEGLKAGIVSDPNALNGKYNAAKNGYGLGVLHEEIFPTSIPERIPVLGKVFKASETAFNGSALYMRHKLANAVIAAAEKNGVDMLDPRQATAHGKIVSSLTGRGEIGKLGVIGKEINVLMFSVRFLKSNFDTLTAHLFDKTFTKEARITSAKNTMRIAMGITALLVVSKMLDEDSVDFDPRSSKFGKICKGNICFDITGGIGGLVTLGTRLVPTLHNGEWGFWTKSATTGKWTKLGGEKYGQQDAFDIMTNFFAGKLSPTAGAIRDIWKGEKFRGEKPTFVNTTIGLITPISVDTLIDELKKGNDDLLLVMLAEAFGISPTDFSFRGTGKKWEALKTKKREQIFNQSLKEVQNKFNEKVNKLEGSLRWEKMNNDERTKELSKIKTEETNKIFSRYGI